MKSIKNRTKNEFSESKENSKGFSKILKQQVTRSRVIIIAVLIVAVILLNAFQPTLTRERAPDFTLTDINENRVMLSENRGNFVLLDFMATWCPNCRAETSELLKFNQINTEDVIIITISVDPYYDTINRLTTYVENHEVTWIVARDTKDIAQLYNIKAIPSLVLIDSLQNIRWSHTGWVHSSIINEQLTQIL